MFPGPPVRSVRMTTISQTSTLVRFLAVSSSSRLRLSSNQHRLGDALLTSSIFHWTAHLHFRHWSEETVKLKKGLKVKLPLPTPGSQVTPPRHASSPRPASLPPNRFCLSCLLCYFTLTHSTVLNYFCCADVGWLLWDAGKDDSGENVTWFQ